jgi:predicted oxidoreductase
MAGDPRADVVVVGAGAAGTCAAIEAAEAGLRVRVLEAFAEHGGAAAWSGGGTFCVGTPTQREQGIEDSVELAYTDWVRCGGEEVDCAWALRYIAQSLALYDWLGTRGVEWEEVEVQGNGNSVPRWHRPAGAGAGLMRRLLESSAGRSIEWRYREEVTGLLTRDDAVVGVETGSGTVHAEAVVVATGGFSNDPEMLGRYGPAVGAGSRLLRGGADQSLGRGHRLLEAVGALFVGLDRTWVYPIGVADHRRSGDRGMVVRGLDQGIWVNLRGERFHDESKQDGAVGTAALLEQEPSTCWAIFDERALPELGFAHPDFRGEGRAVHQRVDRFLVESPHFHRADTVEQLAQAAGLPADRLAASVDELNAVIRAGAERDPRFGRPLAGLRPIEGAICALRLYPIARKALGGVRTDLGCRVLRPDGSVVRGLYAAGEVAGMAGGSINGRAALEGTMLGPSLFSGRIAGMTVATDSKEVAWT